MKTTSNMKITSKMKTTSFRRYNPAPAYTTIVFLVCMAAAPACCAAIRTDCISIDLFQDFIPIFSAPALCTRKIDDFKRQFKK